MRSLFTGILFLLFTLPGVSFANQYEQKSAEELNTLLLDQKERYTGDLERGAFLEALENDVSPATYQKVQPTLIQLLENRKESTAIRVQILRVIREHNDDHAIPILGDLLRKPDLIVEGAYKGAMDDKVRLQIETLTTFYKLAPPTFAEITSAIQKYRDRMFGWDSGELYTAMLKTMYHLKETDTRAMLEFMEAEFAAITALLPEYEQTRFVSGVRQAQSFLIRNANHLLEPVAALKFLDKITIPMSSSEMDDRLKHSIISGYRINADACAALLQMHTRRKGVLIQE